MASSAERHDYSEVAALVSEKAHNPGSRFGGISSDEDDLLVSECVDRKSHGRVDVFAGEVPVCCEQVRFRRAFAQLAQDELNRNPRAADDGFAEHHIRIDVDSVRESHKARRLVGCSPVYCCS